MSKVVSVSLKKDSVYCFVTRGLRKFAGTLLEDRNNVLVIKSDEGVNEIPRGDVYFYFCPEN